jgi:hypothetical protein
MHVFRSRKFWAALIGIATILYVAWSTQSAVPVEDIIDNIMIIVSVYIGSVAVEDGLSRRP